eukprot:scaffold34351_cov18-Tisochrysis_lutea.AAC.1
MQSLIREITAVMSSFGSITTEQPDSNATQEKEKPVQEQQQQQQRPGAGGHFCCSAHEEPQPLTPQRAQAMEQDIWLHNYQQQWPKQEQQKKQHQHSKQAKPGPTQAGHRRINISGARDFTAREGVKGWAGGGAGLWAEQGQPEEHSTAGQRPKLLPKPQLCQSPSPSQLHHLPSPSQPQLPSQPLSPSPSEPNLHSPPQQQQQKGKRASQAHSDIGKRLHAKGVIHMMRIKLGMQR